MNSKIYLFALFIGLIAVFIRYIDNCQTKTKNTKIMYIKTFLFGTTMSLLTSVFFNYGTPSNRLQRNYRPFVKQDIFTGNPDF